MKLIKAYSRLLFSLRHFKWSAIDRIYLISFRSGTQLSNRLLITPLFNETLFPHPLSISISHMLINRSIESFNWDVLPMFRVELDSATRGDWRIISGLRLFHSDALHVDDETIIMFMQRIGMVTICKQNKYLISTYCLEGLTQWRRVL